MLFGINLDKGSALVEIAAVPQEVTMCHLRMRRFVRRVCGIEDIASPRDQGYLEALPWLTQFIPLRYSVSPPDSQQKGISFMPISAYISSDNTEKFSRGYLTTLQGQTLCRVGSFGGFVKPHDLQRTLRRLKDNVQKVGYFVGTYSSSKLVTIRIFKFPKDCTYFVSFMQNAIRLEYERTHPKEVREAKEREEQRSIGKREVLEALEAAET